MRDGLKTHEDKYSIGLSFPTFHHLRVLCKCPFEIHGEQSMGLIKLFSGVLSLRLSIRRWTRDIWRVIYGYSPSDCDKVVIVELSRTWALLQRNILSELGH